jgi:hypothetical protein
MSKATDFVKSRQDALATRPKIELAIPGKDGKCLFRVSRDGNLEYHYTSEFSVLGEHQGETHAQYLLSLEEALKLAEWIQRTFK